MNYLDLTAEQAAQLAAGQVVEVWERMEPQPPDGSELVGMRHDLGDNSMFALFVDDEVSQIPAPHPPGTRARVVVSLEPDRSGIDWIQGTGMDAISTTTRVERRGDDWGFVTGWVQDKGVK